MDPIVYWSAITYLLTEISHDHVALATIELTISLSQPPQLLGLLQAYTTLPVHFLLFK